MSDQVFQIELPDGRVVGIQAENANQAAMGARALVAREKGEAQGKGGIIDNMGRSLARGASLGFADEFSAAARSEEHTSELQSH